MEWRGTSRHGMDPALFEGMARSHPLPGVVGEKVHEPVELGCLWDFWFD
jgi:hypothetical protein